MVGPVAAETLSPEMRAAVEAAVADEMAARSLPSLALGIWIGGEPVYLEAKGPVALGSDRARAPDDPFRIGSVTKTAIGTAALLQAAEGKLDLASPVSLWFPDFPGADRITVEDLLRMRSGLWDPWTEEALVAFYADPLNPPGMDEMIARAAAAPGRMTAPGGAATYINLNYMLLDRIVSAVDGRPTLEVLAARVFEPLGMTNTELPTGTTLPGPLRGYGWNAGTGAFEDKTELQPAPVGGAGSGISTLSDLRVMMEAFCKGTMLTAEAQARRMETAPLNGSEVARYGEGIATLAGLCGHNGTIMGFSTEAWVYPEADATIVLNVARLDSDDRSMSGDLLAKVARIVVPEALQ